MAQLVFISSSRQVDGVSFNKIADMMKLKVACNTSGFTNNELGSNFTSDKLNQKLGSDTTIIGSRQDCL